MIDDKPGMGFVILAFILHNVALIILLVGYWNGNRGLDGTEFTYCSIAYSVALVLGIIGFYINVVETSEANV